MATSEQPLLKEQQKQKVREILSKLSPKARRQVLKNLLDRLDLRHRAKD